MNNLAEVLDPEVPEMKWPYDIHRAAEEAERLHELQEEAALATELVDKAVEKKKKELAELEERRKDIVKPLQEEMNRLESNLTAYHRSQLKQGGDKTIKLPWATLTCRRKPQDYIKDDGKLLEWVQDNAADYIKVAAPTVAWGEFKKQLVVAGGKVLLKETGEVVEGVEPKPIEISFGVEVL